MKYNGIWVMPWQLQDEGAEQVCAAVQDLGINTISLGVHMALHRQSAGSQAAFLYHNPKRKTFVSEDGVIYFTPHEELYGTLKPRKSAEVSDSLKMLVKASQNTGVKAEAWLTCFHDPYVLQNYPEASVTDVYGTRERNILCVNNPESQTFVLSMVRDILEHYDIFGLELDYVRDNWPGFYLSHVDEITKVAASHCFCPSCQEKARDWGLDMNVMKTSVSKILENQIPPYLVRISPYQGLTDSLIEYILDDEGISQFLQFRRKSVSSFFEKAKSVRDDINPKVVLSADLFPPSFSWKVGQNFIEISQHVDVIKVKTHYFFNSSSLRLKYVYEHGLARQLAECDVCAGVLIRAPASPSDITIAIGAAQEAGVQGLYYYCYDAASEENLDAVKTKTETKIEVGG
ncbi:MAG: hypothetical protein HXS44_15855 [Theionarchaea archaeon]|nr:hypothetical protein [Theionarchaea archaeon]